MLINRQLWFVFNFTARIIATSKVIETNFQSKMNTIRQLPFRQPLSPERETMCH